MKSEYLLFNIVILIAPMLSFFLYSSTQIPKLRPLSLAIVLISVPYLIWDYFVTDYWWKFNPDYTVGVTMGTLPIEEVLFFLVVPLSCLVIWENIRLRFTSSIVFPLESILLGVALSLIVTSSIFSHWYTLAVGIVFLLLLSLSVYTDNSLRKKNVLIYLLLITVLIFIFNGYLTARPIVLYNSQVMTGLRIGTVPIEDFIYGWGLLGGITILYEQFRKK